MKYWIAVACREHVKRGVAGGFMQVCHGKGGPLKRMAEGDWVVYYSPVEVFEEKVVCRRFTAMGRVGKEMMEVEGMWRREVDFMQVREAGIEGLIETLSFIKNKRSWGFPFRRGCFEVSEADFEVIRKWMM